MSTSSALHVVHDVRQRVIGIDPSLTGTGVSDGDTTWLVRSSGKKTDSLAQRTERLLDLRNRILDHTIVGTDLILIEGPAYASHTGHMHDRSGLWWQLVTALHLRGHQIVEVPPKVVKKYATGKGNAPKSALIDAAARRFPGVDTGDGDENRVDALWLAAMGVDWLGGPSLVSAAQREALDSIAWPLP